MSKIYNAAEAFKAAGEGSARRRGTRTASEDVRKLARGIMNLDAADAAAFVAAVETAADYIRDTRKYYYFSDSAQLAALILAAHESIISEETSGRGARL